MNKRARIGKYGAAKRCSGNGHDAGIYDISAATASGVSINRVGKKKENIVTTQIHNKDKERRAVI